jgi:hypothetical protein
VLKKKLKNDLDSKDSSTGFGDNISGKQIAIDVYNTLIKVLAN